MRMIRPKYFVGYHRSSYWGIWSRVLEIDSDYVWELDLTPINSQYRDSWRSTEKGHIRRHMTAMGERDEMTLLLPPEIEARMIEEMGEQVTNDLLSVDYMSLFRKDVFGPLNNGGAYIKDLVAHTNLLNSLKV